MNKFLIGFTYHEPEGWEFEDCESCIGVYVTASTLGEAIAWTEHITEELLRAPSSLPCYAREALLITPPDLETVLPNAHLASAVRDGRNDPQL